MFQIFTHSDLFHQLVLVTVHSGELTDMSKHVLQTISELESIHIPQSELYMSVDDKFGKTKDFSTQMESVTESRLLPLFGREGLDRFQIHVVVEMQVVEILSVDEEIEHVIPLSADLKAGFDPVERRRLEEFGILQTSEQISLGHSLGSFVMQSIQNVEFELSEV